MTLVPSHQRRIVIGPQRRQLKHLTPKIDERVMARGHQHAQRLSQPLPVRPSEGSHSWRKAMTVSAGISQGRSRSPLAVR